ncbi:DNA primase [Thalassotalea agarivorans]|uniref:DNA primase n=2 Tax=Thalassotalea agarivorans TaxID=349064 RepID=A0A1H9Y969_THASX|nr:DNA primase [Thalassotalea agarivorans]SES65489.1 DNA primase [Thalassotalea agarivorans]
MPGLIPRHFIDDLLARADIVEIIDARVPLKKAGKNYQACCPFHTEKTPSFSVSQDKQFYHCFGCGEHGNAISFIMEFDRLEFPDAVEELASFYGMEVPREERNQTPAQIAQHHQQQQQKQDDFALMQEISRFYQLQLRQASDKATAIDYLKGRGLSGEIVKAFGIGYISDAWDGMMNQFATTQSLSKQLVDLGMAIESDKGGKPYDRFRGRIMFPIHDRRGRVIGFGGRVLGDGTPKYLNSPETRIYHKGQELYGLFEAKKTNKQLEQLIIVEGYMDVVALAQHGVTNAVASLGTSTTFEQLQLLFRTVKEVVCCYDGDRAGREAAWRAMENALPLIRDGISLKFVFVPDGEDPDSLVRSKGKAAFEEIIAQAQPLSAFLFEQLLTQVDTNTLEGKAALVDKFQPLLKKLPESVLKEAIINELANNFGTGSEQIANKLSQSTTFESKVAQQNKSSKGTPVRRAIALLLEFPQITSSFDDLNALTHIAMPGLPLLIEVFGLCKQNPNGNSAQFIEHFRGRPEANQLAKVATWEHHVTEGAAEQEFIDTIDKIFDLYLEQRYETLKQKIQSKDISQDEYQEFIELASNKH